MLIYNRFQWHNKEEFTPGRRPGIASTHFTAK